MSQPLPKKSKKDALVQARVSSDHVMILRDAGIHIPDLIRQALAMAAKTVLEKEYGVKGR